MTDSNILDLALDLIRIPSISSDLIACRQVLEHINAYLDHKGQIITYNDKVSLIVANYDTNSQGKHADIVLNGHIDVVPPTQEGQLEPYIDGDKLYGRGAGDMKAGVAMIVELMRQIYISGNTSKKILLIITSDEEVGGFDGVGSLVTEGRGGDLVLIPDSGELDRCIIAEKGTMMVQTTTQGSACHSSRPRLGDNAISKAYRFFTQLQDELGHHHTLKQTDYRGTTCSLTEISGGTAMNMIPDTCSMTINIRYTEQRNYQLLHKKINTLAQKHNTDISIPLFGENMYTQAQHPLVQTYLQLGRSRIGEHFQSGKEHGASDGRFFSQKGSCVILHRPTCGNIHSANERVSLSALDTIFSQYRSMIAS